MVARLGKDLARGRGAEVRVHVSRRSDRQWWLWWSSVVARALCDRNHSCSPEAKRNAGTDVLKHIR